MKKYRVHVNGVPFEVELEMLEDDEDDLPTGLPSRPSSMPFAAPAPQPVMPRTASPLAAAGQPGQITSPLTGAINRIIVKEGQSIRQGSVLLEIDAMKMNTKVFAPDDGVVTAIHVKEGDNVTQGQLLITTKEA